ncbi:MAG TPA: ribbon-helix-helix protein, CopG family [Polyangiaceae bacterium]|nr:ribbon-helix-helix protein, CopG family [Polyangiaceae bacterium]
MTGAAKLKVSLTLSADLVALVDRDARRSRSTRSGVIETWLRRAATASARREIEEATAAYYLALRAEADDEEEALSKALSSAAKKVRYDEAPRSRGRR